MDGGTGTASHYECLNVLGICKTQRLAPWQWSITRGRRVNNPPQIVNRMRNLPHQVLTGRAG
jgi:hypothetical protein